MVQAATAPADGQAASSGDAQGRRLHACPTAQPPAGPDAGNLTEVVEDRAERASTLIAGHLPVTDWHAVIGDPNQADAICDRLFHDAHRINLKGRSMGRTHDAPDNRPKETT